jgi:hypothetical protein
MKVQPSSSLLHQRNVTKYRTYQIKVDVFQDLLARFEALPPTIPVAPEPIPDPEIKMWMETAGRPHPDHDLIRMLRKKFIRETWRSMTSAELCALVNNLWEHYKDSIPVARVEAAFEDQDMRRARAIVKGVASSTTPEEQYWRKTELRCAGASDALRVLLNKEDGEHVTFHDDQIDELHATLEDDE